MKKSLREEVYKKYDKHCAYCGKELKDIKDMQVDHIIPIAFFKSYRDESKKNFLIHTFKFDNIKSEELETIKNLNPSCRRCNHYKRHWTLEEYRQLLIGLEDKLRNEYLIKVAIDYGIIKTKEFNGKFYFEKSFNQLI